MISNKPVLLFFCLVKRLALFYTFIVGHAYRRIAYKEYKKAILF